MESYLKTTHTIGLVIRRVGLVLLLVTDRIRRVTNGKNFVHARVVRPRKRDDSFRVVGI